MNKILFNKHLINGLINCRDINEALKFLLANNVNINKTQLEELRENYQEKLNKADKLHLSLLELENIAGGGFFAFEGRTLRYHRNLEKNTKVRIAASLNAVGQRCETAGEGGLRGSLFSTIGRIAAKGAEFLVSSQPESREKDTFFSFSEGNLTVPFKGQDSISFIPINIRHFDDKAPGTDPVAPIPGGTHTPSGSRSSSPFHASESPKPGKHAKAVNPINQQEETNRHVAESIAQTLEPSFNHDTLNLAAIAEVLREAKEVDREDMIAFNAALRENLTSYLKELQPQYHFTYLDRMAKLVGDGHSSYEVIREASREYKIDLPERKAALAVEQYAELPAETFVHFCLHLTDASKLQSMIDAYNNRDALAKVINALPAETFMHFCSHLTDVKLGEFAKHYISDEGRKGNLVEALKLKDGDTAKEYVEKVRLDQSLSDVLDEKVADLCRQHSEYLHTHKELLLQEETLKQPSLGAALKETQPLNTLAERLANLSFDDEQLMRTTTEINTYFSLLNQVHAPIPEEIIELNDFLTEEIIRKFRDSTKPEDVKDQIEKLEKIINEIYEKYKDKIERCQSAEEGVLKEFNCYGQYLKEKLEATDCSDGDVGLILICLDKIGGMVAKEDLETFLVNFISKNLGYREALSKVTEATEEVIKKKRELILKVLKLLKKPTGPVIEKINLTDIETGEQTDIEIKEQIRKWIRNFNFTIVVASKHKPVDELGKAIEFFTQEKQLAKGNVEFTEQVNSEKFTSKLCIILENLDKIVGKNPSEGLKNIDISINKAFLDMEDKEKFFDDFLENLQKFFNAYKSEFTKNIIEFYSSVIGNILDHKIFKKDKRKDMLEVENYFNIVMLIFREMGINEYSGKLIEKVNAWKNEGKNQFDIYRIETYIKNNDLDIFSAFCLYPFWFKPLSELLSSLDYIHKFLPVDIHNIKILEIYFANLQEVKAFLNDYKSKFKFLDVPSKGKIKLGNLGESKFLETMELVYKWLKNFNQTQLKNFDPGALDAIFEKDEASQDGIIGRAFLSIVAVQNSQEIYEKLVNILEIIYNISQPTEQQKRIFVKIYQGLLIQEGYAIDKVNKLTFVGAKKKFEEWLNSREEEKLFQVAGNYSDFLQEEEKRKAVAETQDLLRAKKEAQKFEGLRKAAEDTEALLRAKKPYEAYQIMLKATKQSQAMLAERKQEKEYKELRKAAEEPQGLLSIVGKEEPKNTNSNGEPDKQAEKVPVEENLAKPVDEEKQEQQRVKEEGQQESNAGLREEKELQIEQKSDELENKEETYINDAKLVGGPNPSVKEKTDKSEENDATKWTDDEMSKVTEQVDVNIPVEKSDLNEKPSKLPTRKASPTVEGKKEKQDGSEDEKNDVQSADEIDPNLKAVGDPKADPDKEQLGEVSEESAIKVTDQIATEDGVEQPGNEVAPGPEGKKEQSAVEANDLVQTEEQKKGEQDRPVEKPNLQSEEVTVEEIYAKREEPVPTKENTEEKEAQQVVKEEAIVDETVGGLNQGNNKGNFEKVQDGYEEKSSKVLDGSNVKPEENPDNTAAEEEKKSIALENIRNYVRWLMGYKEENRDERYSNESLRTNALITTGLLEKNFIYDAELFKTLMPLLQGEKIDFTTSMQKKGEVIWVPNDSQSKFEKVIDKVVLKVYKQNIDLRNFIIQQKIAYLVKNKDLVKAAVEEIIEEKNEQIKAKQEQQRERIKTIALGLLAVVGVAGAFTGLAFGASYIPKLISKQNAPQQNDDYNDKDKTEEKTIKS